MRSAALGLTAIVVGTVFVAVPQVSHSEENAEYCRPAPKRWSDAWYEERAMSPSGTRQHYSLGKLWPPYPRPMGPKQQHSHKFHDNHYWPWPHICQDRQYVRSVLDRQMTNGWVNETTLYDYHFDAETHRLTRAGELQLEWIVFHAPSERRMAFVQATSSMEVNQLRLASVRDMALAMVGTENAPPVMVRNTMALGRPAVEIVNIRRAELESQPEPRVPLPGQQTSGSSNLETGL